MLQVIVRHAADTMFQKTTRSTAGGQGRSFEAIRVQVCDIAA